MIDETEFGDVVQALARYRPAGPDTSKAAAIAALLTESRRPSSWRWWTVAAATILASVVIWTWHAGHMTSTPLGFTGREETAPGGAIPADFSESWFKQARQVLPWETPNKPVVVTVFLDWQCVGCFVLDQNLREALEEIERLYPGRITVIFEDWPWDPSCNPAIPADFHPRSCDLARAVRQARQRGDDRELIDWLRDHQKTWKDRGLPEKFRVLPSEGDAAVRESIAKGQRVGIKGTPTTFINGVRTVGVMSAQQIEWAIRLELARAGGR